MILTILGIIGIIGLIYFHFLNKRLMRCTKCKYPFTIFMENKFNKGYSVECSNCGYRIFNEEI
jgi:DNA-directed RNA polymerase subunit RPC12/RpoP